MLIGLNESIVVQQIHYWIRKNQENNINYYEGHYWTYNTYADWQKQFPFWSEPTIKRIFLSLEKKNILISGNFNQMKMDRTKWYRINYEALNQLSKSKPEKPHNCASDQNDPMDRTPEKSHSGALDQNDTMEWIKMIPSSDQNDTLDRINMTRPIPETNTEITTETNNNNIAGNRYRKLKENKPTDDDVVVEPVTKNNNQTSDPEVARVHRVLSENGIEIAIKTKKGAKSCKYLSRFTDEELINIASKLHDYKNRKIIKNIAGLLVNSPEAAKAILRGDFYPQVGNNKCNVSQNDNHRTFNDKRDKYKDLYVT